MPISQSLALKGIALLMLLAHHLFYIQHGWYDDIAIAENAGVVQRIGLTCKCCVAIFVFLSGYGLAVKANETGGVTRLGEFYRHRYLKLMVNFWFVFLIFVPVGVLAFHRGLTDVYGTQWTFGKLAVDFLGLADAFRLPTYNATWWFMSCIILLYAVFPPLYQLVRESPLAALMLSLALSYTVLIVPPLTPVRCYIVTFACGIWYACNDGQEALPPLQTSCQITDNYIVADACGAKSDARADTFRYGNRGVACDGI